MNPKILLETTVWNGNTPNHIYALTDSRTNMVAYLPNGDVNRDVIVTKPRKIRSKTRVKLTFSTARRKFVEVKDPAILRKFEQALSKEF